MRVTLAWLGVIAAACGPATRRDNGDGSTKGSEPCPDACSADQHSIVDCQGNVVLQCAATDACDPQSTACTNACAAQQANHRSVGCDYYATDMDNNNGFGAQTTDCYAAFVANTWTAPAHLGVEWNGMTLDPTGFTRFPVGAGQSLTYAAYDPVAGIPPGGVAIVFLGGSTGAPPLCPTTAAVAQPGMDGTGIASSFHLTTDVPVVAYQINPYGGGSVAVTGASLLLPTSAWDTNYVAVNVTPMDIAPPSMNIIAYQDGTTVTLTPNQAVVGGGGIPAGAAGAPLTINLAKGQQAQITQAAELTGSVVTSNTPVGLMAGQPCMRMPVGTAYCDHGEQMVPPVKAMGSEYVGVMYRPRVASETQTFWRLIGAVDGTNLTYSSNVGGPPTLNKGQSVNFETGTPFVVTSQDADHPFMLFTYMTSSTFVSAGYGDPDFVYDVPPAQFLSQYVFFADPTYPETNLVIIRAAGTDGQFHDVTLDCAGVLTGWQPIGNYQWTRADLMTGNFQQVGNCSTGQHEIHSDAPFGLQVWGWGTPLTGCLSGPPCPSGQAFTENVSYGYPGGMNVAPINTVVIE